MLRRVPAKVQRALIDLLHLHGPIDEPIKAVTRYRRRRGFTIDVDPGHLLTVLNAVEAGELTAADARSWAKTIEFLYRQRVHQVADWPPSEETDQTRTRLVLHHLSGTAPCWLGLDPYGLGAMRRFLSLRDWDESVRVLRETLTDPANPLTYAYTFDGSDLALYPTGDRGFILAMSPPEDASIWAMPQKLATGILTKSGDLKVRDLFEFDGGGKCTPELIRSALAPHRQDLVDHLAAYATVRP
ncbi:hypothetical protein LO763_11605 [Glycomyces sp. A-F 0318]|uniref:hypothetical protein n=1 Tax=Glycomyces amatae TaxID=2881355 RepID=UPI001E482BAD|nr:hypothetical protein [Glycomyces amatae]MCD0444267.1 hypothetical protein [Glycomyces amatae]